eukprot:CAMPEP_0177618068 /NCGR_PEP_ID=MMETSP0419_2-20121207/25330_1 /TAXON_ID=582737 /ORGANISM="Tetraselmis sp., Strain GSL018" /LENGTH=30 /DNA_ID= /DNA_START= /DNA_END= /DNA_ORIENTATION=
MSGMTVLYGDSGVGGLWLGICGVPIRAFRS